jgi:hypothetical protein
MRIARTVAVAMTLVFAASGGPLRAGERAADEGVKVHGHWMIEVRNADGSLSGRYEIENALAPAGRRVLAGILGPRFSGTFTVRGRWLVVMAAGDPNAYPCFGNDACSLGESGVHGTDGILTVALAGGGDTVKLSGSVRADRNGRIDQVLTLQRLESSSGTADVVFSSKLFFPVIEIVEGQTIDVSVVLSFS